MILEWTGPQNIEADTTIFDTICHHQANIFSIQSIQSIHSPQKSYFLFLMVVNEEIANFFCQKSMFLLGRSNLPGPNECN